MNTNQTELLCDDCNFKTVDKSEFLDHQFGHIEDDF